MAHLRRYAVRDTNQPNQPNAIKVKYFDPRCVDGIDLVGQFKLHFISGAEYPINFIPGTDVEQWAQDNIIAIAGENPDTSGC